MSKISNLKSVLNEIVENWNQKANEHGFPTAESDPNWPSPCVYSHQGNTYWKPVLQAEHAEKANSFRNVGEAFDIKINEQYDELFTAYFSDNLNLKHVKGEYQLLQAWSQDDFERLQQNLIGHLLMKQKLKQGYTLFFALTEEDDLNLVVDNETGEVCLEYVGKEPHEVVAKDLVSFLDQSELSF